MSDFIHLCPLCENCFSSETSLKEHHVAVHSSPNHVCHVCHKILEGPTLLERHVTAHLNQLHCCNICGELCENKVDVYIHVTTSHKYGGKMVCDLCSQTFSTSSSLKVHSINKHAGEMPRVLQKWELFCNVHSSQNLGVSDALKDSFYPSDECPLHPKEKEFRDGTNSVSQSNVLTPNQSILLSETIDDNERPRDCSGLDLTELQIFLREQGDKESWCTKSTDHLSSSVSPNDILERVKPFTENKNRLHKDQPTECQLCDSTFDDRNDYLSAHDGKDPSNVYTQRPEEKPASQTRLQDLLEFRKLTAGNTSHIPSKKCVKGQLSGNKTVAIHQDEKARDENQNDQLEPNGTASAEISALTHQIQNKNASVENRNDQFEPNGTLLPSTSALTMKIQNKNASSVNQNEQLEANGTLLAGTSALTPQIQNKNTSEENQKDQLEPNGTLLAGV